MVELKNIKIDGNIVKCEIYPEDSKESGYIEVDVNNGEIKSFALPNGYEWCKSHLAHAKSFLIENFTHIRDIPIRDKTLMWY